MLRYFLENRQQVINTERVVYAVNRRNFSIPVSLLIKVVPELDRGIQILGVFARVLALSNNTVLLNANTGEVLGITESTYDNYGIHPWLCKHTSKLIPPLNFLNLLSEEGAPVGLKQLKEKAISSRTICLDTSSLVNLSYTIRADPLSYKVPLPKNTEYRKFKVRIFPGSEAGYGIPNLSIMTLEIRDNDDLIGFGMRNTMGLLFHQQKALRDDDETPLSSKKTKKDPHGHADLNKTGRFRLSVMKTVRQDHDNAGEPEEAFEPVNDLTAADQNRGGENKGFVRKKTFNQYRLEQELNEKQLEEMEKRAERERKLKEHRQILKTRSSSMSIIGAYAAIIGAIFIISTFQTIVLSLKLKILDAMQADCELIATFSKREVILPELAFLLTKMNNSLQ